MSPSPVGQAKISPEARLNELRFDLRTHLYRIYGVDLTEVPGINALTAHVLFAEIGSDLSRLASGPASPRGWAYALTTGSAAARSFRFRPALSKIERLWRCAWQPSHCIEVNLT